MSGKFITFEGVDGAGKSMQAARLAAWLRQQHHLTVVETREPGGTPFAERLRDIILHSDNLGDVTETLLLFAARCEHLRRRILPALAGGAWVVCDRFNDSSIAYQGGGRGVSAELINTLIRHAGDATPDLSLYLESPPAALPSPTTATDAFEREGNDFFQRTAAAYRKIADNDKARVVVVAGSDARGKRRTPQEVETDIRRAVQERLLK